MFLNKTINLHSFSFMTLKMKTTMSRSNKRTGKKWVIEHFGMMDKASYYENALQKLDVYEKNNILVGVDLIFLHETSGIPLSINSLRKYILNFQ